jgi:Asp/Glu/hydantoin racemase
LEHGHADLLRSLEMVEGVIEEEKAVYDAAVIGCSGGGGLAVLEALVDIRVIGPCEAAIMMA